MVDTKVLAAAGALVLMAVAVVGISIPAPKPDEPLNQLALPLPPGACALSDQHHRDKVLIRDMRSDGQGLDFRLERLFADCDSLEAWRTGQASLGTFGFYLESVDGCALCRGESETYVQAMARHAGKGEALSLTQARKEVRAERSVAPLGILRQGRDSVVLGYLSPANRDGSEVTVVLKVYFGAEGRDLMLNVTSLLPEDQALEPLLDQVTSAVARAQHASLML